MSLVFYAIFVKGYLSAYVNWAPIHDVKLRMRVLERTALHFGDDGLFEI